MTTEIHPLTAQLIEQLTTPRGPIEIDPENEAMFEQLRQRQAAVAAAEQRGQALTAGPLGNAAATGRQITGNMANRGRGIQNSLLQVIQDFIPDISQSPLAQNPITGGFAALTGASDEEINKIKQQNREEALATEDLLAAIQKEAPIASGIGDTLTFVAEAAAGGKQFKHKNPKVQWLGRTGQEAAVGLGFGLSSVGMSDEEKEMLVGVGLLTGAITPSIFQGAAKLGGKAFKFSADRIKSIANLARMEKLFDKTGLLTMGELLGHRGIKKLEAAMDNIPFLGLGKKRDRQFKQFTEMVETLFNVVSKGRVGLTEATKGVRERLARSLFNRFHRNYDTVSKQYDILAGRLDDVPAGAAPQVRLANMQNSVKELLDLENSLPKSARNEDLIKTLEGYLTDPHIPWKTARVLLRRIKEQAAVEGDRARRKETTREFHAALTKMEIGLVDDMNDFAVEVGRKNAVGQNLMEELDAANDAFKRLVLPFYKSPVLSDITSGEDFDIDSVVRSFLNPAAPRGTGQVITTRRPSGIQRSVDVKTTSPTDILEPTELDVVRGLMLREALDLAQAGGDKAFLRPERLARELGKMQDLWGETFSREQKEVLSGYITLADKAQRAFRRESAIGPLVTAGAVGLVGANKLSGADGGDQAVTDASVMKFLVTLLGARVILGTRAGTDLARMAARMDPTDTRAGKELLAKTQLLMIRYVEDNFPQLFRQANPDTPGGPMEGFNPFTDPHIQNNPPRQDLRRQ